MAEKHTSRLTIQRAVSLGALALGFVALTAPTLASAQDRGHDGDGRGGQVYQNRGDRIGAMQRQAPPAPPAPPAPAVAQPRQSAAQQPSVRPAPGVRAARNYPGQGGRWQGNRAGQDNRAPDDRGQGYRGPGSSAIRDGDQRAGSDAQREAYRNAREGQNRGDGRENWRTDRNDNRGLGQDNRNGWQNGGRAGWQNDGRRPGAPNGNEAWRNGNRDNRSWDRGWRSNDRYDWSSYRSRNRNIFSAGRYYAPYQNYSYRRLGIGFSLGSSFYGSRYWIDDPYYYRLPEVYGPYRWVRYYDDVLLVDIYTGEVVDAIYDFFY